MTRGKYQSSSKERSNNKYYKDVYDQHRNGSIGRRMFDSFFGLDQDKIYKAAKSDGLADREKYGDSYTKSSKDRRSKRSRKGQSSSAGGSGGVGGLISVPYLVYSAVIFGLTILNGWSIQSGVSGDIPRVYNGLPDSLNIIICLTAAPGIIVLALIFFVLALIYGAIMSAF